MKSKNLKNIIKYSEEFNPSEDVWEKIKTDKEPIYSSEIIKVKKKEYNTKLKSSILATAALICIAVVTVGIFSITQPAKAESTNLMKGITKSPNIQTQGSLSDNFIKSTSSFSMELFKQTANTNKKGNVLISPASTYLALGLTLNGADGDTKKIMESALGKYGLTSDELNINYKTLMDGLTEKNGDTVISIANSIWYNKGFNVKRNFLQKNADYFNAGAYKLDFKDKNSVNAINAWIKGSTNNLIDKIVDEIPDKTVMYLINTVYFNGKWESPFDPQSTFKWNFKGENGTIKADFMVQQEKISYIQTKEEQAVLLPYKGGRFSFLAILPKENTDVRTYLQSFNENTIRTTISGMKQGVVALTLPKFNIGFDIKLNNVLKNMGLGNIFLKEEANFNKMGDTSHGNIYVSEIEQKTFIKVGEKGTEAAAATTNVEMGISSVPSKIVINFDHPFIYAIVDNKSGLPIFLGIMENPTEK